MASLDVQFARSHFPSLKSGFIFADNAGGSQAAQGVIEKFTDYLINTNAQLGADYSVSAEATRRVMVDAPVEAAKLLNAKSPNEIVFGPSSTSNLENLARGLAKGIQQGDEFIITGEHEGMGFPLKVSISCYILTTFMLQPTPGPGRASHLGQAPWSSFGSTRRPTLAIRTP